MSIPPPKNDERKLGEWVRITGGPEVGSLWVWNGQFWTNLITGGMMYVLSQQASIIDDVVTLAQNEARFSTGVER